MQGAESVYEDLITSKLWSAPAERSGDGALALQRARNRNQK